MTLRTRESAYCFREKYEDLNRAFKKALLTGTYTSQYDAMKAAVESPSTRYWTSAERLYEVVRAIDSGNDPRIGRNEYRRQMYFDLYQSFKIHRNSINYRSMTDFDICEMLVYSPAKRFYMNATWGMKLLYKGRKMYKKK